MVRVYYSFSNITDFFQGQPCDSNGVFLPKGSPPLPLPPKPEDNWLPFSSRVEFELTDFLYTQSQMLAAKLDKLLDIWHALSAEAGALENPIFKDHKEMYERIDAIDLGDIKWECFTAQYMEVDIVIMIH